jgi:hypothetical protein
MNKLIENLLENNREALSMLAKDDIGKPDLTYLPYSALKALAYVAEFGANKYGRGSWDVPDPDGSARRRFIAAALRHLHKRASGEKFDDESGHDHLAHAAMSCIFALAIGENEEEVREDEIFKFTEKLSPYPVSYSFVCSTCNELTDCEEVPEEFLCAWCK